jgi:thioredoxin reductase
MSKTWDAVVIGAGPAGASCAVWLRHLGFEPLLLEASDRVGGLAARNPYPDIWTVTSPNQTGEQVAAQIAAQVKASGVTLWTHATVQAVAGSAHSFEVSVLLENGQHQWVQAKTVVIASGVRPRGLPGQSQEWFDGVLIGPGQEVMSHPYEGLSVAILGGGDNAFENYEFVKQRGAQTAHVFARTVRAQRQYQQRAAPQDVFVGPCEVNLPRREVNGRRYDLIMVFYGWEPQAGFVDGLARTDQGFLATDAVTAETSSPGVYAIGEVAQRMHPCVPTAMADGVVAAKAIERSLNMAAG